MNNPSKVIVRFELIPDLLDFQETYIDLQLAWLSGGYASIGSEEELRCHYEYEYFQRRLLELDAEFTLLCQAIYRQYQQDLEKIKIEQEDNPIDAKGIPAHIQNDREISWIANKQVRRREQYEADLDMLEKEFKVMAQNCSAEIKRVQNYQEKLTSLN